MEPGPLTLNYIRNRCLTLGIMFSIATLPLLAASWPTFGNDPQRDGWARHETVLSRNNAKDLKLDWKIKLGNASKELNSLTAPLVISEMATPGGFRDEVIVAGASDNVYAIAVDSGKLLWKQHFIVPRPTKPPLGFLCPNALNATPVVGRAGLHVTVYVITSDGKLHSLNAINGADRTPAVQFVPANSKNWSLNLFHGTLFSPLSQGCVGANSALYSLDIKNPSHPVHSFIVASGGAGIWGRAGAAISREGIAYVETGDGPYDPKSGNFSNSLLAIQTKTLKLVDYYTPNNYLLITHKDLDMGSISPVVFPFDHRELVVGGGKEGVLYLLDANSLGGADHHTPLFRSPKYANEEENLAGRGFWGAFASRRDKHGTRWLYAPALGPQTPKSPRFPITNGPAPHGSIMAFKVGNKNGSPVLVPAWRSRDMSIPDPPIVANGVVYALSTGEDTQSISESGGLLSSAQRISHPSGNATLYAFDAATGKQLYSSGKIMPGFSHFSGLALANGHIYSVTYQDILYSFGVPENPYQ